MSSSPPPSTTMTAAVTASSDDDGGKLHIVMFPWLAFGHMIPYLELSKLIAQKGHKISFVSTPRNIDRLPKLPPALSPFINFVKIPLPSIKNLPENAEATIDLPYEQVKYLKLAYDGLQQPLSEFLETSSPDWVLHDFAAYWFSPMAHQHNIPTAFFSIFIAAAMGFFIPPTDKLRPEDSLTRPEDFTVSPRWVPFPSTVVCKLFEIRRLLEQGVAKDDDIDHHVSDLDRFINCFKGCDLIAIRSCSELELEWLQLLEQLHQKPVIPVGLLPPTEYRTGEDAQKEAEWRVLKEWLDMQAKGSVVYVAFGSEVKPSQVELTEIALGLEISGLPFFWALRKQRGTTDIQLTELPDGFEERVKGRGVVWTSWAPQLKILSHDSVGGFLNHSGCSSVVEAIMFERPLVLLTFLADQGIHARIFEEKRLGYWVPRNERDGSFTQDLLADSLRLVIVEEEGKIYRDKVKEMKSLLDKDRQEHYVDNLLSYLRSNRGIRN